MAMTYIAWRSIGIVIAFHSPKAFSCFLKPIHEQLEGCYSSTQHRTWESTPVSTKSQERTTHTHTPHTHIWNELRGLPSPEPAPWEWAGERQKEGPDLRHESCSVLLRQPHVATWFPLQPCRRDATTWGTQVENETQAFCAWSLENVPSISQLQKHLCPTALCRTAVKIYSVRLLSAFLTSQPKTGWSQSCQWIATGSERKQFPELG